MALHVREGFAEDTLVWMALNGCHEAVARVAQWPAYLVRGVVMIDMTFTLCRTADCTREGNHAGILGNRETIATGKVRCVLFARILRVVVPIPALIAPGTSALR